MLQNVLTMLLFGVEAPSLLSTLVKKPEAPRRRASHPLKFGKINVVVFLVHQNTTTVLSAKLQSSSKASLFIGGSCLQMGDVSPRFRRSSCAQF